MSKTTNIMRRCNTECETAPRFRRRSSRRTRRCRPWPAIACEARSDRSTNDRRQAENDRHEQKQTDENIIVNDHVGLEFSVWSCCRRDQWSLGHCPDAARPLRYGLCDRLDLRFPASTATIVSARRRRASSRSVFWWQYEALPPISMPPTGRRLSCTTTPSTWVSQRRWPTRTCWVTRSRDPGRILRRAGARDHACNYSRQCLW